MAELLRDHEQSLAATKCRRVTRKACGTMPSSRPSKEIWPARHCDGALCWIRCTAYNERFSEKHKAVRVRISRAALNKERELTHFGDCDVGKRADGTWEIEHLIGKRRHKKRWEYLDPGALGGVVRGVRLLGAHQRR